MSVALDDIRYFITVTKTLNVTRASEIIGITQPTLSYSIKRLERELGGDLIIRLKNGVRLTKFGEEFKEKGLKIIHEWEALENLVTSKDGELAAKYSLGIHPSVALYTLHAFMPKLKNKHPKLGFSLFHGPSREVTKKVINWEIDFGIVVNPKKHPDLVIIELCKDRVGLFGTKIKNDLLILDDDLNQSESLLKKMQKAKIHFNNRMTSKNLEVVAKLTSIGHGVGVLPERVANQYSNLKLLNKEIIFQDKICLIYRSEKHKDIAGKTVIKEIKNSKY